MTGARVIRLLLVWLLRLGGLAGAVWAFSYGLGVRNDLWTWSAPVRFTGDIGNGLGQGNAVLDEASEMADVQGKSSEAVDANGQIKWQWVLRGFVHRYDTVVAQSTDNRFGLDYTPARLLVMSFWARYVRRVDPGGDRFAQEDALPLLMFNTGCEIDAALLMFLLVRYSIKRSERTTGRSTGEWAWIIGLIAALISWFNPSTLLDAHMWPQWDVWIVPCYLAAMFLASIELWFCAGICLAIGAMFKGQIMMVAPVLALWPLFGGRFLATIRILLGFLFAGALCASPWLVSNELVWEWIGSVLMLAIVLVMIGRYRGRTWPPLRRLWPIWGGLFIIAFVARPCGMSNPYALALGLAVAATPWLARHLTGAGTVIWLAAIFTASVLLSAFAFGGTWTWYTVGFEFPTRHFLNMANGGASNMAAILGEHYNWHLEDPVLAIHGVEIPMKTFLVAIYAFTLVLCAIGGSLHYRRNDPRVLISLTAPWVLMFAILPQMHERYLMWGGAVCGVGLATSLGMGLMGLVVAGISVVMVGRDLLSRDQDFLPATYQFFAGTHVGIGWMVALAAGVYLFVAVVPARKIGREGAELLKRQKAE